MNPVTDPDRPDPGGAATEAPRPRRSARLRAGALIGVLTALLGFAIAVQVHANSSGDKLAGLREDDLIGILDNQNDRADRLREQITQLQQSLQTLQDSGNRAAAARRQVRQEAQALGILLGTLPATGPGVVVDVADPKHKLQAEDLLDVIEELRGAGAEAISFGGVRVSTATAFTSSGGTLEVDGTAVPAPYHVVAIGDPKTLDTALNIPGGVAAVIRADGGELAVGERAVVTISVTRTLSPPRYARPAGH
jgi:uncharacterized protein YlxW (UPF0749 family)